MKNSTTNDNTAFNTSIDELQFRRSIYADPSSKDEEIIAAKQSDPAKQKLAHDLCQFDEKLKQAMNIPVPDDLCNKLLLRQTFTSHQQNKRKTRIHLALAASVAIITGVAVNYLQSSDSYIYNNLGDYALAHVYHEEGLFSNNANNSISLTELNKKMNTFNGNFKATIGDLISADYCRFDGMKSLHLVFKGATDTVAVFIVPKKEHLAFIEQFSDAKLNGKSLSFEHANVLVVANKNESLNQWQQAINSNIAWSI